jgi:WD40 repeat protein
MPGDRIWGFERAVGCIISTSAKDSCIRVWDGQLGAPLACFQAQPGTFENVLLSKDGRWVVSVVVEGQCEVRQVWDVEAGKERSRLGGPGKLRRSLFSPDSCRLLGISVDERLYLWNLSQGGEPLILSSGSKWFIFRAFFSPDSRCVLCEKLQPRSISIEIREKARIHRENAIWVWDAETGRELLCLPRARHRTWNVEFSSDGRRLLAVASDDPSIRVWEFPSGRQIAHFRQYPTRLYSAAFSPDSRYIATSEMDQTIRLWDVESSQEVANLHAEQLDGTTVEFAKDGQWIVFQERLGPGLCLSQAWDFQRGILHRHTKTPHWQAVDAGNETRFEVIATQGTDAEDLLRLGQIGTQQKGAWFPLKLWHLTRHHESRIWAGASGGYLCLLRLEGDLTVAPV